MFHQWEESPGPGSSRSGVVQPAGSGIVTKDGRRIWLKSAGLSAYQGSIASLAVDVGQSSTLTFKAHGDCQSGCNVGATARCSGSDFQRLGTGEGGLKNFGMINLIYIILSINASF